jgi:hypothetical protein
VPVNYSNGTPGDFVASGSSLLLLRAAADTRGQYSTLHSTRASIVRYATACKGSRGGRRRGGEDERRRDEGMGEGAKEVARAVGIVVRQQGLG